MTLGDFAVQIMDLMTDVPADSIPVVPEPGEETKGAPIKQRTQP
jgi:hypothetical protein